MSAAADTFDSGTFLPDFCDSHRVLSVLVIAELVALLVTFAGLLGDGAFWQRLFLLSVYLQWIGICSAAALCLLRRHTARLDGRLVALLCYLALLAVTFAVSEVTYIAGRYTGIAPLVEIIGHGEFVLRNLGICAVVAALALRYFWLRAAWQRQARAEAEARYQALQARIRPHFLFNCLNSIASLIAVRPADAETAIEDLSQLLRASLEDSARGAVSLAHELAVVDAYLRIEALRLGERLRVNWRIDPAARDWPLPALCLQPLVENAVGHGIAQIAAGGEVRISADVRSNWLVIEVANPLAPTRSDSAGQRLALANIAQRLALRYAGLAQLTTQTLGDDGGQRFLARLVLPREQVSA